MLDDETSLVDSRGLEEDGKKAKKRGHILFDVTIQDPLEVEERVFRLWLFGLNAKDASAKRIENGAVDHLRSGQILHDTKNQYRNFALLERFLATPCHIHRQTMFVISPAYLRRIVQAYYAIDGDIVREFLGKKKLKLREQANTPNFGDKGKSETGGKKRGRNYKRTYDNIYRTYTVVADVPSNQSIPIALQDHFLLPLDMARQYTRLSFMSFHRIESSKKKLRNLSYTQFDTLTEIVMKSWCNDHSHLHLSTPLVESMRDLKEACQSSKRFTSTLRDAVCAKLTSLAAADGARHIRSDKAIGKIQGAFPAVFKVILTIGGNISKPNELKDLYADIVDLVELLRGRADLKNRSEAREWFSAVSECFDPVLSADDSLSPSFSAHFKSFIDVMEGCALKLYLV
eukprot:TRINITY_DN15248_c0_g1_i1.p1 TRINITY_DN15248_c0_g1~~TRINITY_DN15248_c0_g1_i1.p1  ORF type:complete len:401 (-),score=129.71 TRINITY_DN15248_c0_g1_i1:85-1287(-)